MSYGRRYNEGKRKPKAALVIAIQMVAQERGWIDKRVMENRKPSLPRVKFMECPPPHFYDSEDWRERVNEWNTAHGRVPLEPSA